MNDVDSMPIKCHDCPYWEMCEKPYVCPTQDEKRATDGFDQADYGTSQTVNVPTIDGVNSFGGLVYLRNSNNPAYEDYANLINVEFLTVAKEAVEE